MSTEPALLDSDTLSELSRGNLPVRVRAAAYLEQHGTLTISAVTVFERLRGYHSAVRAGKPFDGHLRQFKALLSTCRILPIDQGVAEHAALIWAVANARQQRALGDILIAATASASGLALVTRNHRDFAPMTRIEGISLTLIDWTRAAG